MRTAYRHITFAMRQALAVAYPHFDVYRVSTDRWHRSWQCEWEHCQTAQRGYTWLGAYFKACRVATKQAKKATT